MKVYLAWADEFADRWLLGIFSQEKDALDMCKYTETETIACSIEEHEVIE